MKSEPRFRDWHDLHFLRVSWARLYEALRRS